MHDKEFRILVLVITYFLFSKSDEVFCCTMNLYRQKFSCSYKVKG